MGFLVLEVLDGYNLGENGNYHGNYDLGFRMEGVGLFGSSVTPDKVKTLARQQYLHLVWPDVALTA